MGLPTSEVGYTLSTTGRGDHKSIRDMWWHWGKIFAVNIFMNDVKNLDVWAAINRKRK
jgi:hypothetical protein